jgi:hypothetical protein
MKNLKQLLAAGMMMGVLMVGTSFAGAGLLVSDYAEQATDPCAEEQTNDATGILMSDYTGILMSDYTGILMSDYTGILMSDYTDEQPVCGILVLGKD